MKTIEIKLYKFNELSEEAKQKAINDYRNNDNYEDFSDEIESLKQFYSIFPVEQHGNNWSNFRVTCDDNISGLFGQRLAVYLWNNYKTNLFKGKFYGSLSTNEPVKHKRIKSKGPFKNGNMFHPYYSAITLSNSCVLTGFYMDDELLAPIYKFLDKPDNTTFKELLSECVEAWSHALKREEEWRNSDEYISEELTANDYDFTEDGEQY
jgi:hypothetical protein